MADPQPLADRLIYAAALAIFRKHERALEEFRLLGQHAHARLWRALVARGMREHRRTQVRPAHASGAKGECIGISQTPTREPFCTLDSPKDREILRLSRESLPLEYQSFRFTTAQLNVGLRPILHRDGANMGLSLLISVGPFVGGGLWQAVIQRPSTLIDDVK